MAKLSSKRCRRCKRLLPITDFYEAPSHADGRRNDCASCMRAKARAQQRSRAAVPDPQPARVLRAALAEYRAQGLSFDQAWPRAVERALAVAGGDSWRSTFQWSRATWRSAYDAAHLAAVNGSGSSRAI